MYSVPCKKKGNEKMPNHQELVCDLKAMLYYIKKWILIILSIVD